MAEGGAAPRRRPAASIREQLLAGLVVPMVGVLIVGALVAYRVTWNFATEAYDRGLYGWAADLGRQIKVVRGRLVVDLPKYVLEMLDSDEFDRRFYSVTGPSGELIIGHFGLPDAPAELRVPVYYDGYYHDEEVRVVAIRIPIEVGDVAAEALVRVAETPGKRYALTQDTVTAIASAEAALILLAAFWVWLGVARGLRPLATLEHEVESRSHRDLTPIDASGAPAEVLPLLGAINALLARLDRALAAQQRFVADAAHQLRTPLAGLRTQIELAMRDSDPQAQRRNLAALLQAAERSSRLVNQLLALARAEPGAASMREPVDVDLIRLARDVAGEWVPRAIDLGVDLGFQASLASARVRGNPSLLRELLSNLVDNAVRYQRRGGHVTVSVAQEGGRVALTVEDDGPGIPPEERERVFERFVRLEVTGTGPEGCGLGLAIVKEIADTHGATVTLDTPASGAGTRVTVRFDRA